VLWAIAAFLIHLPAIPQNSIPPATTTGADLGSSVAFTPSRTVPERPATVLPTSRSIPLSAPMTFVAPIYIAPEKPRYEHSSRRLWFTLTIAQHGASTFDAWSTRRVISSGQCQEQNPLLKPFAENASLYATIQVGPLALDYLGHRMMKSQHGWARHAWWLPQALGTAVSLASAAHNLHLACATGDRLP
jgi:hypothetical protein